MKQNNPQKQIKLGDRWYTDDQFQAQLGTAGPRRVVENRWNIFYWMIVEWMNKYGNNKRCINFLDAGCGDGINLVGMHKILSVMPNNIRFFGLDYNPIRAQRAFSHNCSFNIQQASLYNLPYKDEIFDIILCNQVLEHIPDLLNALCELYRVLSPDGLFIAGIPNEGCLMARLRNNYIQPSIARKTDHTHFFTEKTFKNILIETGFTLQSAEYETFFFPCSYLNNVFSEFSTGHLLMSHLRRIFPGQAGGLIFASIKAKMSPSLVHIGIEI